MDSFTRHDVLRKKTKKKKIERVMVMVMVAMFDREGGVRNDCAKQADCKLCNDASIHGNVGQCMG